MPDASVAGLPGNPLAAFVAFLTWRCLRWPVARLPLPDCLAPTRRSAARS